MPLTIARAQDGIPVVQSTADRTARFPAPPDNQRVQNLGTGGIERYSVATGGWVTDLSAKGDPRRYGAVWDGITDDTAALQAAITAANGGPVELPVGTGLFSTISNVPGKALVLIGAGTNDSTGNTTLTTTAGAGQTALAIDQTVGGSHHYLKDIILNGNGVCDGGVAFGSATTASAFVRLDGSRVINFTATGAFGISLNSVQEFDAENVFLAGNYNNLVRPAVGYCTTAVFRGPAGYNGLALNYGFYAAPYIGQQSTRIMFADQYVFESNAKDAIHATGTWIELVLDGAYFENNATSAGDVVTLSGVSAHPATLIAERTRFDAKGRSAARNLNLDYVSGTARCAGNVSLFGTAVAGSDVVTTATVQCHFEDNGGIGTDIIPLYQALSGKITWSETGLDGVRSVGSVGGGLRFPGSTPASATAAGLPGTVTWDGTYLYVCTGTNAWKRVAVASW